MNAPTTTSAAPKTQLLRILGLDFGLAVVLGGTVGVGILRLPGTVAAQLGSFWPILAVWLAGGIYSLLGSFSVAELSAMLPQAGGFYVYGKRAFGNCWGSPWDGATGSTIARRWPTPRSPRRST